MEIFGAVAFFAILFVAAPAVFLHYATEWRRAGSLKAGDERMIEDLWRSARGMEHRIETLEAILDDQAPHWRRADPDGPDAPRPRSTDPREPGADEAFNTAQRRRDRGAH